MAELFVDIPMNCPFRYVDQEGISIPNCQYTEIFTEFEEWEKCLCEEEHAFPKNCPLLVEEVVIKKK